MQAEDGNARDGTFGVVFRLYNQSIGGAGFYAEQQEMRVEDGLFSAYLGDGSPVDPGDGTMSPPLDFTAFANAPQGVAFLGVTIGNAPELSPRLRLGSAPYAGVAAYCSDAGTVGGQPLASLQPRITGQCPTGQAVTGFTDDGRLICTDLGVAAPAAARECRWLTEYCPGDETQCTITCPETYPVAVSGGCDGIAGAASERAGGAFNQEDYPFTYSSFPDPDPQNYPEDFFDGWVCESNVQGGVQTVYIRCCTAR